MEFKSSYEDQNPRGAILKKVSAVRESVEVLLFADTAQEFLSKQERIMRESELGEVNVLLHASSILSTVITQLKGERIDVEVGEIKRRTKKTLFIMVLYIPSPHSQCLVS